MCCLETVVIFAFTSISRTVLSGDYEVGEEKSGTHSSQKTRENRNTFFKETYPPGSLVLQLHPPGISWVFLPQVLPESWKVWKGAQGVRYLLEGGRILARVGSVQMEPVSVRDIR